MDRADDVAEASSQSTAVEQAIAAINARLEQGDRRMDAIQNELSANTEITRDIRDLMSAARVGFKVLGTLGLVAKWFTWVTGAVAAAWALFHHGQPPIPPK